jgi:hypothetical protein
MYQAPVIGLEPSQEGIMATFIGYHGTSKECAERIIAEGWDASRYPQYGSWMIGPGVYTTPDKNVALTYARNASHWGDEPCALLEVWYDGDEPAIVDVTRKAERHGWVYRHEVNRTRWWKCADIIKHAHSGIREGVPQIKVNPHAIGRVIFKMVEVSNVN